MGFTRTAFHDFGGDDCLVYGVRISGEEFRAGILPTACARFRILIEDQHTGDELKVELVDTASLGAKAADGSQNRPYPQL